MEIKDGVRWVMPDIWEIDGKKYSVTLTEQEIQHSPFGRSSLDYTKRALQFTPLIEVKDDE